VKVSGACHTGFSVVDLDEAIAFYELFGCEVLWRRETTEQYFRDIVGIPDAVVQAAQMSIPGTEHIVELFEYAPQNERVQMVPNTPGHMHLCFKVDDLPAWYEQLEAAGVRFISPPVLITAGVNTGGYGVYAFDPSGNQVEIFQPPQAS
jgi:catechol 2,3-dioxygenase-like lactoylglutathione lyase family enzyme